jgi:hypothetical protein
MKIEIIFADEYEGLHSAWFSNENDCEFDRLFDLWVDRTYLLAYCKKNAQFIFNDYWRFNRLEEFIEMIVAEADTLMAIFDHFAETGFGPESGALQQIFLPLDNRFKNVPDLQESKAKAVTNRGKLRMYALRIDKNTFVVTGGCIKFTHRMEEHEDTKVELTKLLDVYKFLNEQEIYDQDKLACYYEQSEY